jgi:hypothetical protein
MKWECKIVKFEPEGFFGGNIPDELESVLNEFGNDGWEVTGVIETNISQGRTRDVAILLKRSI